MLDQVATTAGLTVAYAACKYKKDWDRVTKVLEEGVQDTKGVDKRQPGLVPSGGLGALAAGRDSLVVEGVLCKAEVRMEVMLEDGWCRTQPVGCGERRESLVSRAESDRWVVQERRSAKWLAGPGRYWLKQ